MTLRNKKPFTVLAAVLALLVVAIEIGATLLIPTPPAGAAQTKQMLQQPGLEAVSAAASSSGGTGTTLSTPGRGIKSMAYLDGLLLVSLALNAIAVYDRGRYTGTLTPISMLISAIVVLLYGIFAFLLPTLILLLVMLALFLAPPFGTLAYLAAWGSFNTTAAGVTLSVILALKVGMVCALFVAQPTTFEKKTIVAFLLTSLVANVIVSFLHGFVPGILASITDAIAGLVIGIVAVVWALCFAVATLLPSLRAVKGVPRLFQRDANPSTA